LNDLALKYKTKVNIHISEGIQSVKSSLKSYKLTPVRFLESLGVLNSHWNLIHAVNIDEEETSLIAKRNTSIIHCPVSNAKTGVGIAPIKDWINNNITIGLGSDACSNNNTNNILNEAYFASLLHSAYYENPQMLPTSTIFQWLTKNGHKIIGSKQTGMIEEGEKADLLLWDLNHHAFVPKNHKRFNSAILYNAPDIKPHTVIINGNVVVKNYKFLSMEEEKISDFIHKKLDERIML